MLSYMRGFNFLNAKSTNHSYYASLCSLPQLTPTLNILSCLWLTMVFKARTTKDEGLVTSQVTQISWVSPMYIYYYLTFI